MENNFKLIIAGIIGIVLFICASFVFAHIPIVSNFCINIAAGLALLLGGYIFAEKIGWIEVRRGTLIKSICITLSLITAITIIVAFVNENYIAKQDLYQLSGLAEKRDGKIFQDFKPRNSEVNNLNVVSWLWADSFRGSSVKATVIEDQGSVQVIHENYLRITFDNRKRGFPPNVAIRSKLEKALIVSDGANRLELDIRMPEDQGIFNKENHLDKLTIIFRVVDKHLTHWYYKQPPGHYFTCIAEYKKGWNTCSIDLEEKSKWEPFEPDGNYVYRKSSPNFSIITSLIVEIGAEGENKPSGGYGTIDIANIVLVDD